MHPACSDQETSHQTGLIKLLYVDRVVQKIFANSRKNIWSVGSSQQPGRHLISWWRAGWWWLVLVQIANESSGHNWQAGGEEGLRMRTGPRIVLC